MREIPFCAALGGLDGSVGAAGLFRPLPVPLALANKATGTDSHLCACWGKEEQIPRGEGKKQGVHA